MIISERNEVCVMSLGKNTKSAEASSAVSVNTIVANKRRQKFVNVTKQGPKHPKPVVAEMCMIMDTRDSI